MRAEVLGVWRKLTFSRIVSEERRFGFLERSQWLTAINNLELCLIGKKEIAN